MEKGEFKYSPLLKIGYTKDIDSRFDSYELHNPGCKLLGKRKGGTDLESYFHSYYSKYKYPKREEWFYYSQEIVDNFQTLEIDTDKYLTKLEYIEGLKKYIKSEISTPQSLKNKYLDNLLIEIENIKSEAEFDKDFHRSLTMRIWEEGYEREINILESFNFEDFLINFPENINLNKMCDFEYVNSLCAQSYIFSDSNSDCLAVDISEDLPQILGRQRLFENPWKNSATFYYRTTADYRKMNGEDFQKIIQTKREKTESLLRTYDGALDIDKQVLAEKYQSNTERKNYKNDYVAVNCYNGISLVPVLNNLVMVNEIRAFKIQQIDYADRFAVFSTVHNKLTRDDIINQQALEFLEKYNSLTEARKKLILLCESVLSKKLSKEVIEIVLSQIPDSDYIKGCYQSLGPERLKNLGYKRNNIEKALGIVTFSSDLLRDSIYSDFKEGDRISLASIKSRLEILYKSINYQSTAKAIDIEKWFEVRSIKLYEKSEDGNRKQLKGYELLKSKRDILEERLCD